MTNKKPRRNGTLAALTGAALSLPAISQLANAEAMPANAELGYRYSGYEEASLDSAAVLTGSNQRYEVDVQQIHLVAPVSSRNALNVDLIYEAMTGASSMASVMGPGGAPELIMTGASIEDKRTDLNAEVRNYQDQGSTAGTIGLSTEDDFTSHNIALEKEFISGDRVDNWVAGFGFSYDEIEPVQSEGVQRVTRETRTFSSAFFSWTRVNSPTWQTQLGVFGGYYDGYLSDPYRTRDNRPQQRQQLALSARSRHYFGHLNAALHGNYRYYTDDWGLQAHTFELVWYQNISDRFQLSPLLRYYSQSQADFYNATDSADRIGYQSSDYRLSPYGAVSYGVGLNYNQQDYRLVLNIEQYDSDGDYALKSVQIENPALVNFTLVTIGLDYRL